MKYLFQRPRDDELITSALIRTCRRSGLSITTAMQWMTKGRKFAPAFFQVSHLECIAEFASCLPADLLWKHSIFPYATAFYGPALFEKSWASAHAIGKAAGGMGATIQNVSSHSKMRRYCPECVAEDKAKWGEAHWRRSHNLPGVLVCVKHRCNLRGTAFTTASGRGSWSYLLPHEAVGRRLLWVPPGPFDFEVADISARLLMRPLEVGSNRGALWYRERLVEKRLLSPGRDVNVVKFISWAQRACQVRVERYGFSRRDARLHWLPLMVHIKNAIPFVPIKYIFLEAALGLQSPATDVGCLDHIPVGLSARPTAARDARYASRVERVLRQTLQAGERIRVCDALTKAGCWSEFRHNRAGFPKVAEVVQRLHESTANIKPSRKHQELSKTTAR